MAETPEACAVNLEDFCDGRTTDSPSVVAQAAERFDTLRSDAYRRGDCLKMIASAADASRAASHCRGR